MLTLNTNTSTSIVSTDSVIDDNDYNTIMHYFSGNYMNVSVITDSGGKTRISSYKSNGIILLSYTKLAVAVIGLSYLKILKSKITKGLGL